MAKYYDRRKKKWMSFLMPEHRFLLINYYREMQRIGMPELDSNRVVVKYVVDGEVQQFYGFIHYVDYMNRTLELANEWEGVFRVPFEALVLVDRATGGRQGKAREWSDGAPVVSFPREW